MDLSIIRIYISSRISRAVNDIESKKRRSSQAGFSLIELLAVTAVIALVSGLILVSNSTFGGKVLLQNLAYDIALSIRQAQVYGIAVQRFGTNTYTAGYGVYFNKTGANASQFILFGDGVTVNGLYDTNEMVQTTTLTNGFKIYDLCTKATPSSAEVCGFESINILYKRPEPDAWISATLPSGTPVACILTGGASCFASARIQVRSPRGFISSVVIDQNGQISVK